MVLHGGNAGQGAERAKKPRFWRDFEKNPLKFVVPSISTWKPKTNPRLKTVFHGRMSIHWWSVIIPVHPAKNRRRAPPSASPACWIIPREKPRILVGPQHGSFHLSVNEAQRGDSCRARGA